METITKVSKLMNQTMVTIPHAVAMVVTAMMVVMVVTVVTLLFH